MTMPNWRLSLRPKLLTRQGNLRQSNRKPLSLQKADLPTTITTTTVKMLTKTESVKAIAATATTQVRMQAVTGQVTRPEPIRSIQPMR